MLKIIHIFQSFFCNKRVAKFIHICVLILIEHMRWKFLYAFKRCVKSPKLSAQNWVTFLVVRWPPSVSPSDSGIQSCSRLQLRNTTPWTHRTLWECPLIKHFYQVTFPVTLLLTRAVPYHDRFSAIKKRKVQGCRSLRFTWATQRRKGGRRGGNSACLKLSWDRGTGSLGESEGERCLCITIWTDVSLNMYIIHWRCG